VSAWLDAALKEFGEIDEEIAEEGYPPVSDEQKAFAREMLERIDSYVGWARPDPDLVSVSPGPDGDLAISMWGEGRQGDPKRNSLLILIEKTNWWCTARIEGQTERIPRKPLIEGARLALVECGYFVRKCVPDRGV